MLRGSFAFITGYIGMRMRYGPMKPHQFFFHWLASVIKKITIAQSERRLPAILMLLFSSGASEVNLVFHVISFLL